MATPIEYYGEHTCSAETKNGLCVNKAYYKFKNQLYCGVHCKSDKRIQLPKNPDKIINKNKALEDHSLTIIDAAKINKKDGYLGDVICRKMFMMKEVELIPGYLNVFPNFKHQNRTDGFGCKELSPMSLGPVEHEQKDLPYSLIIENYHQGNKKFNFETDDIFYTKRNEMYIDPIPHRHKYDRKTLLKNNDNINIPDFSVHLDNKGNVYNFTYIQSRYFYCHFYEKLAKETKSFKELQSMHEDGINLCIIGYDAYPITKTIQEHYEDPSKPFGHELVLYSLLTIDKPSQYPWNIYYKEHKKVYHNILKPNN